MGPLHFATLDLRARVFSACEIISTNATGLGQKGNVWLSMAVFGDLEWYNGGCVLTGRNHRSLGPSAITGISIGFPAHNGYMGFEHGFLSEMLLEHGTNTFAVG